MQAHLAKNRLEAEGIPVILSGDAAAGLFGAIAATPVQLQVAESNLRGARWILQSLDEDDEEEPMEESSDLDSSTAVRSPRPAETPLDESAVQASPPRPRNVLDEDGITTAPRLRELRPGDD